MRSYVASVQLNLIFDFARNLLVRYTDYGSSMNYKLVFGGLIIGAALLGLSACGSLATFNTLVPFDSGKQIASNVAFGQDPRQTLDVYGPAAQAKTAKLPVIVFIYGGSWASGSKSDYGFAGAALAAKGFITVLPDYRLVPKVVFPEFVSDAAFAMRWVQDNIEALGGDPNRIVLMGHSAGAYNAMMIALDQRYLAQAGVKPSIIKGVVGMAGPYDFYPFDVDATKQAFGQFPDPAQTQTVTYARKDAPPILLLTAEADTTVNPRNARSLTARLNTAGAKVTNKIYPDLGHVGILLSLSKPLRYKAKTLEDATDFAREVTTP